MKKLKVLVCILVWGVHSLNAQNVNIPDANFKAALVANLAINTNGDAEIQVAEAQSFTGIVNVHFKNINSLTGIEEFTALTELDCSSNNLSTLDISACTALTVLSCAQNNLTTLDLSACVSLVTLNCSENSLTFLNVSTCSALTYLSCWYNELTALDISTCTALTTVYCSRNKLSSLDISANIALTHLYCNSNPITTLNTSTNMALMSLTCYANCLHNLDISTNTALTYLSCHHNLLTALDVSANTALTYLDCSNNWLSSLDISTNTALTTLYCNFNMLTALDCSTNIALISLRCNHNHLTTLNVKNGNNQNMPAFFAMSNFNLTCIEVDDAAYSTANWTYKDSTAFFATDCSLFSNISTQVDEKIDIQIYPNPTSVNVNIVLQKTYDNVVVNVQNAMGQTVLSKTYHTVNQIDLNLEGAAGVYFVNVRTEEYEVNTKVMKN